MQPQKQQQPRGSDGGFRYDRPQSVEDEGVARGDREALNDNASTHNERLLSLESSTPDSSASSSRQSSSSCCGSIMKRCTLRQTGGAVFLVVIVIMVILAVSVTFISNSTPPPSPPVAWPLESTNITLATSVRQLSSIDTPDAVIDAGTFMCALVTPDGRSSDTDKLLLLATPIVNRSNIAVGDTLVSHLAGSFVVNVSSIQPLASGVGAYDLLAVTDVPPITAAAGNLDLLSTEFTVLRALAPVADPITPIDVAAAAATRNVTIINLVSAGSGGAATAAAAARGQHNDGTDVSDMGWVALLDFIEPAAVGSLPLTTGSVVLLPSTLVIERLQSIEILSTSDGLSLLHTEVALLSPLAPPGIPPLISIVPSPASVMMSCVRGNATNAATLVRSYQTGMLSIGSLVAMRPSQPALMRLTGLPRKNGRWTWLLGRFIPEVGPAVSLARVATSQLTLQSAVAAGLAGAATAAAASPWPWKDTSWKPRFQLPASLRSVVIPSGVPGRNVTVSLGGELALSVSVGYFLQRDGPAIDIRKWQAFGARIIGDVTAQFNATLSTKLGFDASFKDFLLVPPVRLPQISFMMGWIPVKFAPVFELYVTPAITFKTAVTASFRMSSTAHVGIGAVWDRSAAGAGVSSTSEPATLVRTQPATWSSGASCGVAGQFQVAPRLTMTTSLFGVGAVSFDFSLRPAVDAKIVTSEMPCAGSDCGGSITTGAAVRLGNSDFALSIPAVVQPRRVVSIDTDLELWRGDLGCVPTAPILDLVCGLRPAHSC